MSTTPSASSTWIRRLAPDESASARLFCLPYAGGGAGLFTPWAKAMPGVEVAAIQLPGRETRFVEQPIDRMETVVEPIADAMVPLLDRPYGLFGHSMGGLIAFETARRLRRLGHPQPAYLFASAAIAPQLPQRPPVYDWPDEEFLADVKAMKGLPDEVLAMPEMRELALPLLRADFAVVDTWTYVPEPPLDCPIQAFYAEDDQIVRPDQVAGWEAQTTAGFSIQGFPGGHFFIHTHTQEVTDTIRADLLGKP
jgi:medium-chain acyl-[acyl-carrier-protein] hydrolase